MNRKVKICPTCKRPFTNKPVRVCWKCKSPIIKFHKFYFKNSRVMHRNCKDPENY